VLRRIRARFHGEVNGYFLCDRGRYGYPFVNSDRRVRSPFVRGALVGTTTRRVAVDRAASFLTEGARAIGIGSPRASLEANFALRALVGPDRFYSGIAEGEHALVSAILRVLQDGPVRSASLHDVEMSDAVLVLGEDLTNTAPMLALALRQSVRRQPMAIAERLHIPEWDDAAVRTAVQGAKGPLFIASVADTRLDDIATATFHGAPDDLARLGLDVAHALDPRAPAAGAPTPAGSALVEQIARALRDAQHPLVVAGTGTGSEAVVEAAANIAWALHAAGRPANLAFVVPECNTLGAALLGERGFESAVEAVARGEADTLVVLENDLYRRCEEALVRRALGGVAHLIVIDHVMTPTMAHADVGLSAGTFAEGDGTFVNNEGRAQRYFQVFEPADDVRESWRWIRDLMIAAGRSEAGAWYTLDDIAAALASGVPGLAAIRDVAPPATFRIAGLKVAREAHRYSGRTAMDANVTVHEPKPPDDPDSALSFTMEGYDGQPPPALTLRYWAPGWNSVQAINHYQTEVGGPLRGGDPGRRLIEPGTASSPYFDRVPPRFEPRPDEWLCVPLHHIFGSEELSALAPGIAERVLRASVALCPDDLRRVGVVDGGEVTVTIGGGSHGLVAREVASMPTGVAGVLVGVPSTPWLALPARGRIVPREAPR